MPAEVMARRTFDAHSLIREHPPRFSHHHKRRLFELIDVPIRGTVGVSRWQGRLPGSAALMQALAIDVRPEVFTYPTPEAGAMLWHVNFADAELFGFYGGPLLAQDEHQVLEHPILGAVREALVALREGRDGLQPVTRDGRPTPYLVTGAQRSLFFDTVNGPYGNAFAAAPGNVIDGATTVLKPPTHSNILAMEAPKYGTGVYRREDIRDALETAYVGFSSCKAESGGLQTMVCTGNWGCGAYGGNPTLMALLQFVAAALAGVSRLTFCTASERGLAAVQEAMRLFEAFQGRDFEPTGFVEEVFGMRLRWGQSDGN